MQKINKIIPLAVLAVPLSCTAFSPQPPVWQNIAKENNSEIYLAWDIDMNGRALLGNNHVRYITRLTTDVCDVGRVDLYQVSEVNCTNRHQTSAL